MSTPLTLQPQAWTCFPKESLPFVPQLETITTLDAYDQPLCPTEDLLSVDTATQYCFFNPYTVQTPLQIETNTTPQVAQTEETTESQETQEADSSFLHVSKDHLKDFAGTGVSLALLGITTYMAYQGLNSVSRKVKNKPEQTELQKKFINHTFNFGRGLLLGGAFLVGLDMMGVNVPELITGLGLIGAGLGFALRDIFLNIISGVTLTILGTVKKGDYIEISGTKGKVSDINLLYVRIDAIDDAGDATTHWIPTKEFIGNKFTSPQTHTDIVQKLNAGEYMTIADQTGIIARFDDNAVYLEYRNAQGFTVTKAILLDDLTPDNTIFHGTTIPPLRRSDGIVLEKGDKLTIAGKTGEIVDYNLDDIVLKSENGELHYIDRKKMVSAEITVVKKT